MANASIYIYASDNAHSISNYKMKKLLICFI